LILRAATPADFPALAAIAEAAYRQAFAAILTPETLACFDRPFFAARFALERRVLVVATDGDGTALGFHLVGDGHIHMLFVDPARQARGTGKALLEDAEARGAVSLESFRDNRAARGFYEKHGWTLAREYVRPFGGRDLAFVAYVKASR
jgi:ribosomal protein S18 acetylase RimI-like enzyme